MNWSELLETYRDLVSKIEDAEQTIEESREYQNPLYPAHDTAVVHYNSLITMALTLEQMQNDVILALERGAA